MAQSGPFPSQLDVHYCLNASEAAEKTGRANDLQKELKPMFESQNWSPNKGLTSIPATFLRVTIARP
jgi:hypothetical protein